MIIKDLKSSLIRHLHFVILVNLWELNMFESSSCNSSTAFLDDRNLKFLAGKNVYDILKQVAQLTN